MRNWSEKSMDTRTSAQIHPKKRKDIRENAVVRDHPGQYEKKMYSLNGTDSVQRDIMVIHLPCYIPIKPNAIYTPRWLNPYLFRVVTSI